MKSMFVAYQLEYKHSAIRLPCRFTFDINLQLLIGLLQMGRFSTIRHAHKTCPRVSRGIGKMSKACRCVFNVYKSLDVNWHDQSVLLYICCLLYMSRSFKFFFFFFFFFFSRFYLMQVNSF